MVMVTSKKTIVQVRRLIGSYIHPDLDSRQTLSLYNNVLPPLL